MPEGGLEEFEKAFPQSTFQDHIEGMRDTTETDPTLRLITVVDELYSNTKFATIHRLSKEHWEGDSTSGYFSWAIQESVGRQFDGDVQYFLGNLVADSAYESPQDNAGILSVLDNNETALRRKWFERELGERPTQDDIDEYVRVHKALSRWMLDVAFPDTDTLTVYRGTTHDEVDVPSADLSDPEKSLYGEEVTLQSNPLTSWTLHPHVAFKFAADSSHQSRR